MAASAASAPLSSWTATAGVLTAARSNPLLPLSLTSNRSGGVALLCQPRRLRYQGIATPFLVRSFSGQSSPPAAAASGGPEMKSTLDQVVRSHKVVLFMKGTKDFPQCGFSNTVVQILKSLNVPFETLNILENEMLRQSLKDYSNWPTFPQLYIDGEFFGGCDITVEAYKNGQLQELLEKAMCS